MQPHQTPAKPLNGYVLIDSIEQAKKHPETWGHPPQYILDLITVGFFVKIGLQIEPADPMKKGERFWGIVLSKSGPDITISVNQDLVHTQDHGVKDKDILIVRKRHIFGILDNYGTPLYEFGHINSEHPLLH